MAKDSATAKEKNRRIRKEALREQLQQQGHLQHVVDILDKVTDETLEIEPQMLNRYKIAVDTKLKLISKYLPDTKAIELTGEDGGSVDLSLAIQFVDSDS